VQSIDAFLRERSVRVLVVSFTPPKLMAAFLKEHPLAFAVVSDPRRDAYRFFELGRTSFWAFFKPRVLGRFIRKIIAGGRVRRPVDNDVMQLGGDFLFDAAGQLTWSWRSRDATDRPTALDIKRAVDGLRALHATFLRSE
jgi:hypothetical protein